MAELNGRTEVTKKLFFPYNSLVLAQVDKYAEIEYSMVESPVVSNSSIDLSLKVSCQYTVEPGQTPEPRKESRL